MRTRSLEPDVGARLTAWLDARADTLAEAVTGLARHESPTGDASRLDALADRLAADWARLGADVTRHPVEGVGTHLEIRWSGGAEPAGPPALLVGHMDTVHDVGTRPAPTPCASSRTVGCTGPARTT